MADDLPDSASVVVIGGGVIGTSIACHLAASGLDGVVLVDKGDLAGGSTCRAAGGVRASFSQSANIEIGLRGLEVYSRFAALYGQQIDFHRDGYLYLLTDQTQMDSFEAAVALQNSYGMASEMVGPARALELSPLISTEGLLGACWSPGDAKATPESVVAGYARTARRHGAVIRTHTEVLDIESSGGTITGVITDRGTIATGRVVCAAGAWSGRIGQMVGVDIPVTPVRRQIAFTAPRDGLPTHSPSLTIDFASSFYFHPEGGGLLIGWSDPDQLPGFGVRFEPDDWFAGVSRVAAQRAPEILSCGVRTGWAGLYEVTPDHNQIIDRSTEVPGLFVATGYSGHGFLMGPATGEIVCDLVNEVTPGYDITGFRLDRFAREPRGDAEVAIV
ncbi:FAD-binding oxidoreductase [Gordonia jinhuaensis]|uniref:FAD-dependent oxidoreductase n=1 Tax=Gordonia jinhuaensis TaxID=1517702 RepID=A0A916WW71_9ACTN|nr:FAD-binding oxidoreductase [Gordonia jinhuaensis]GGB38841.1 FAD-dependent oxidoreductase [Gordonia jinhuaensis]